MRDAALMFRTVRRCKNCGRTETNYFPIVCLLTGPMACCYALKAPYTTLQGPSPGGGSVAQAPYNGGGAGAASPDGGGGM